MATISHRRADGGGSQVELETKDVSASHPYTCNTCQVAFRNSDLQRGHARSDWHRYNLKRRIASLPPISDVVFTEKVLQARAETAAQADKAGFERACETCRKTYYSENSFRNHLSSAKHKARAAALATRPNGKTDDEASSMSFSLGEPAAVDSVADSDAEDEVNEVVEGIKNTRLHDTTSRVERLFEESPVTHRKPAMWAAAATLPTFTLTAAEAAALASLTTTSVFCNSEFPNAGMNARHVNRIHDIIAASAKPGLPPLLRTCLFCNYESGTRSLNAHHMERIHGMFIPERKYLVDLGGLLDHLHKRIFSLNECLTCGKVKTNVYALQAHMRDKGHCQIPYTTEEEQLEIGDFYDFRSTYSDAEEQSEDESGDEEQQSGGAKLGAKRTSKITGEDGDEVMEDDSWETDSEASSLDSLAELRKRVSKHTHNSRDTARDYLQDSRKRVHAAYYDDYQLHLPSGKSVGHRSLNRYYRQNLYNYPTSEEERAWQHAFEMARPPWNVVPAHGRSLIVWRMHMKRLSAAQTRFLPSYLAKEAWRKEQGLKKKLTMQSAVAMKQKSRHPATYMR